MKPIIILPEGAMSAEAIKALNDNGICTVEAKNPAAVRFLDPIPSAAERTKIEDAAIQLSRKILNRNTFMKYGSSEQLSHADICRLFTDAIVNGTKLDSLPTQAEIEKDFFDTAKASELRQLAREEAKAERAAAKASRQQAQKKP